VDGPKKAKSNKEVVWAVNYAFPVSTKSIKSTQAIKKAQQAGS